MGQPTYSDRMRERHALTGEGHPVDLGRHGVFWSRGWRGCPRCEQNVRQPVTLRPFRDGDRSGWRCGA
jgi:hypothetical protein